MSDTPIFDSLEQAFGLSIASQTEEEIHAKWVKIQYKFMAFAGDAALPAFAGQITLDMLLRGLEAEMVLKMAHAPETTIGYGFELFTGMSGLWVSRTYELVRASRQRCRKTGQAFPETLAHLLRNLELVQMPMDK